MKSDYRVRAIKFIHSIIPEIKRNMFDVYSVEAAVAEYNKRHHRRVNVKHGAVRIVLITSDYVVKWDYDGGAREDFGGCEEEYNLYNRAVHDGFSYLLAEPTLYEFNDVIFSIMPRINGIGFKAHSIAYYCSPAEKHWIFNNIEDIHDFNWGFYKEKPIIIDYASGVEDYDDYDDDEEEE